jgi:tetratricopeptide (TPR) repeat protein
MKGRRPTTPPLAGRNLWRFRLLALAVPLLVLLAAEAALRLAGYGYPTAFLLPSANHDHPTFVQNSQFGARFFGARRARAPHPISISRDKPPEVVRIFVFGESAAYGDPQPSFGLPRVLQSMLSLRHPGVKFEVVNAAMTAINSHVIVPIARDCAKAGGDIWVIYMGNNEVVGPFGAGTVFGPQSPPVPLVRASLALKSTRLGQWMDSLRAAWHKAPDENGDWGGMMMFLDQQVRANDPRMAAVYLNFWRNLSDIIRAGHESGAGIVVSTVAVNLKDCAPFASEHRAGLADSAKAQWEQLHQAGVAAENSGKFSEAEARFQAAAAIDGTVAELQFHLGRCALALRNVTEAQARFAGARDLDTLRFRCDSRLNELIRQAAAGRENDRILLADSERALAAASPDGLPGGIFFYEHVHPTFEGNYLLARTIAEQIEKLLPPRAAASSSWPTESDCARRLGRTNRDLAAAVGEIMARLTQPPFSMQINHDEQMRHVAALAQGPMETVAQALKVTEDALAADPDDALLHQKASALKEEAGDLAGAAAEAERAVDLLPSDAEAWSQLGIVRVRQEKYEDAAAAFVRAFDLNQQDVWPLQNLAMTLVKSGRKEKAARQFRRALEIQPRFGLAWLGLGQVLESMGQKDEAAACFEKGLANRIHHGSELATLARFCQGRGWLQAASTNFADAITLAPSDATLRYDAGQNLAAMGRHREAAARYAEAARLSPDWGQAHFQCGREFGRCDLPAEAAREFREAARLMPDLIEPRLDLGIALAKEGQAAEALKEFETVAARSPTNAVALHYIEVLRAKPAAP